MNNIAVFASGNGSNAQRLAEYFNNSEIARVSAIYCNNPNAYVIKRAETLQIPVVVFTREQFKTSDGITHVQSGTSDGIDTGNYILNDLRSRNTDIIVLAGFLWLLPDVIIKAYPRRIINIHPALLPLYGGKGMYGTKVHESVILNKDIQSGITIHLVNEEYDKGEVLFQAECSVSDNETPDTLAQKIHLLEYEHFPVVIENYLKSLC